MTEMKTMSDYTEFAQGRKCILDFYSPSCVPCKAVAHQLEVHAGQPGHGIRIAKINVENQEFQELVSEFAVRSLPTVVFLHDGSPDVVVMGNDKTRLDAAVAEYSKW